MEILAKRSTLSISECFKSIQGEGPSIGVPSIFLRLKGCNLTCGGIHTVSTKALDSGATWRCDTIETWIKGTTRDMDEILADWKDCGYIHALQQGAHLVITGGEPLLDQDAIVVFLERLSKQVGESLFVECETNGTLVPSQSLVKTIHQFNVSPKLSNSGMSLEKRINHDALLAFVKIPHTTFKYVIATGLDLDELFRDFIAPFQIPHHRIYLMPAAETRAELIAKSPLIAELCKTHQFRFSNRLHLMIWDQKTGV